MNSNAAQPYIGLITMNKPPIIDKTAAITVKLNKLKLIKGKLIRKVENLHSKYEAKQR